VRSEFEGSVVLEDDIGDVWDVRPYGQQLSSQWYNRLAGIGFSRDMKVELGVFLELLFSVQTT